MVLLDLHLGLALTAAMLTVHVMQQVAGVESSKAIIAGTGHMLLTDGIILLFLALRSRLDVARLWQQIA